MKILLVGEFSGVHNNLKQGLMKLGHQVVLAASGDGYRGFDYDFNLKPYRRLGPLNHVLNTLHIFVNIHKLCGYDVVQFITPFTFPTPFIWLRLYSIIFKSNRNRLYYVCGGDLSSLANRAIFKYFPQDDKDPKDHRMHTRQTIQYKEWFINSIDGIVPSMYEYSIGHRYAPKCMPPIRLPIVIEELSTRIESSSKLRILHGITRSSVKGSSYIKSALRKVEENFSESVTITIVEKLPFADYLKILENNDVLVDQCKSYSYGMNALVAMSKGLIVLSGSEPEAMEYLGVEDCPIINIVPDENQIYSVLLKLITDKRSCQELKRRSLDYVDKYHNAEIIAHTFDQVYRHINER